MTYFFSKVYPTYNGSPFKKSLNIDYLKCENCGFVISKTHKEMADDQWKLLNKSWHHNFERNPESRLNNQPPYADQALAITILQKNGLLKLENALDYAAGYGTLAKFLKKYLSIEIKVFDKYVEDKNSSLIYIDKSIDRKYSLVINSAMFEHIINRESLDQVDNQVSIDGVLMLHTVVCEKIPKNPNWFYLDPMVHTAFHTNKSMNLLMKQWNYSASIYCPQAKSWFLFKNNYPKLHELEDCIRNINKEIQSTYFYYKLGFMDYWKG
jgi:hypothetical protein